MTVTCILLRGWKSQLKHGGCVSHVAGHHFEATSLDSESSCFMLSAIEPGFGPVETEQSSTVDSQNPVMSERPVVEIGIQNVWFDLCCLL